MKMEKPMVTQPKAKKRLLPRPGKGRSFEATMESANKRFAGTFAKLAK